MTPLLTRARSDPGLPDRSRCRALVNCADAIGGLFGCGLCCCEVGSRQSTTGRDDSRVQRSLLRGARILLKHSLPSLGARIGALGVEAGAARSDGQLMV